MPYVIYALIDPRDTTVRYVGMTNDLTERFITHLRSREVNNVKNDWMRDLRVLGLLPICRTLHVVQSEREAREAERNWIEAFLEIEQPLYNSERIGKR
jgi:hypothetical protein